MNHKDIFEYIKRVQAIAETGKNYSHTFYDIDRYNELHELSIQMLSLMTNYPQQAIQEFMVEDTGYKTPKVDIRAVVFNNSGELLYVREKKDNRWSLPGGWADVGYSPSEVAEKETSEEAGMQVKAKRILAVLDKHKHAHPRSLDYVYKIFIECVPQDNVLESGSETLDARFFSRDDIPELSEPRILEAQIKMLYKFYDGEMTPTIFD
jgi:ADP-ribose pyrophosphatase YjhB (NUDIX family)